MSSERTPTTPKQIDWELVHQKLETLRAVVQENGGRSAAAGEVLKKRARELSRSSLVEEDRGERVSALEFELSGERYAVPTSFIEETFPLSDFTPLFCTPPYVLGIINLRGRIVSIIDLRRFFELPVVGLSNLNRVIVVRDGEMEFGIVADAIEGIRELPLSDLQRPLPTMTGVREEFLAGITRERLALLDMAKILSDPRVVVQQEVE